MAAERDSFRQPNMTDDSDHLVICRCEEVTRGAVLDAIADGATTLNEIKWRTRTGMGLCQGKTCGGLVMQILSAAKGVPLEDLQPFTHRPPVRPVPLGVLASISDRER